MVALQSLAVFKSHLFTTVYRN